MDRVDSWGLRLMCGVLGVVGRRPSEKNVNDALVCISTRGPDARGVLELGPCLFGHTRLSIIDAEGGLQPFRSACGRYALTYNGEIYNYRELMGDLAALGCEFKSRSDTEVLLMALIHWGKEAVYKVDGMFAFAFWDAANQNVLLARDRLGIKPLFYSVDLGGLQFGSTTDCLIAIKGEAASLCPKGVADYFSFHTTLAPRSFYQGIESLEPGHVLEYHYPTKLITKTCYWRASRAPDKNTINFDEAVTQLDGLMQATVAQQLNADVPVGLFLSGGIDSSLITHYAASHVSIPLKTYSVSFKGTRVDESSIAAQVADFYSTSHTEIPLPEIDADAFIAAINSLDQPIADPAYIPMYAMSKLVSSEVKVVLSGDGADELFGGYQRYLRDITSFPDSRLKKLMRVAIASGLVPGSLVRRSLHGRDALRYLKVDLDHLKGGRKAFRSWFNNDFLSQTSDYVVMEHWFSEIDRLGDDIEGLMKADWTTYLSENCLVKTDRSTMAFGLEGRVPFLGQTVVDYAESLTSSVNFAAGMKSLPTALAKQYLPATVWDRPKHGFTVPVARLFRSAWRDLAIDMASNIGRLAPFLDASRAQKLLHDAVSGSVRHPSLAYSLLVYLVWSDFHSVKYSDN